MGKKCYTREELLSLRLIDLPTVLKENIFQDIEKRLGFMTDNLRNALLNRYALYKLDMYCDLYKFIKLI